MPASMAARSNKIFRDILFKQYKYNSKIVSPTVSNIRKVSQNAAKRNQLSSFRHPEPVKVTPIQIKLSKDLTRDAFLQPALLPALTDQHDKYTIQWPQTERVVLRSTTSTAIHQEPKEAINDIFPKTKSSLCFLNNVKFPFKTLGASQNRQFSTMLASTRFYSSKKDNDECPAQKRECYKACPKWQLNNCPPQGNNLDCLRPYVDPCCKKKMAPYPSYSETCAERLDDDLSECMQCPWTKCGGADNLKFPKRKYHTATAAAQRRFHTSLPVLTITETLVPLRCDLRKPPCKRPPPKCDRVQKKEECPPKDKGPCRPPFEKKKCDKDRQEAMGRWGTAFQLWSDKNNVVPLTEEPEQNMISPMADEEDNLKMETLKDEDDCKGDTITPDNSCCDKLPFDKRQMDYEHVSKKQCPKATCVKKKRKRVPDGCDGACGKKCAPPTLFDSGYDCQKKKKHCPKGDCARPKCPKVDLTIDRRYKPRDPCCERTLKEMAKGRRQRPKVFVPDSPNHDGIEKDE